MAKLIANDVFLEQLIKTPELVIDKLDLLYVYENHLKIQRSKNNKTFIYLLDGKPVDEGEDLKRIKSLVIPPAWKNVKISLPKNGHLQAIGKDVKNRKQYRYHPLWVKIRSQTKFFKMIAFGKQLSKIRKQVDKDLEQTKWTKSKVIALVIRLMEETHIRVGNEQYAKRNKTYGLTTLRNKHVSLEKNNLKFEFVGKKGKKHQITLRNKKLIRLVNRCEEIPGWELFQYYDSDGKKQRIDSGLVNEYLQNITSDLFTAKDFRTWGATVIAFETLKEKDLTFIDNVKNTNVIQAYDAVAKELGNTRNVCKKYYVHPFVINSYLDGSIKKAFIEADTINNKQEYFSNTEIALLNLLKDYTPKFL